MARLVVPQVMSVRPSACMDTSQMEPECASISRFTSLERNLPSKMRNDPIKG